MLTKKCKNCGKVFNNKRNNGGSLGAKQFNKRKTCSLVCGMKNRHINTLKIIGSNVFLFDNKNISCLIDKKDIKLISNHYWRMGCRGYFVTYSIKKDGRRTGTLLHRFLLNYPNGVVDHINRNKLDNRRKNLRVVTQCENVINSNRHNKFGCVGVSYSARDNSYRAEIKYKGTRQSKGFKKLDDAIKQRKEWEQFYDWKKICGKI